MWARSAEAALRRSSVTSRSESGCLSCVVTFVRGHSVTLVNLLNVFLQIITYEPSPTVVHIEPILPFIISHYFIASYLN